MSIIENPTGETILLYVRHEEPEMPHFGLLEIQMSEGMTRYLTAVSRAVVAGGLNSGTKSIHDEALAGMTLVLEDNDQGDAELRLEDQSDVPTVVAYPDGSVRFVITVQSGRSEYTYESDYLPAETVKRLGRGEGISPIYLEEAEDLYFAGEYFRDEAMELFEALAPRIERWAQIGSQAA